MTDASIVVLGGGGGGRRPAAIPHGPLPQFDPSDGDGTVHTTLPPSQIIPPHFTDPWFMRADFNGVTLDLARWSPGAPMPLPSLVGANTTPLAMLMTPMVILYPRYWQDADLTEHAERGYDDFVIAPNVWNAEENGYEITPAKLLAWCQYVKSWGFRIVIWQGGHPPDNGPDAMLDTLFQGGVVDSYIHGKEVDIQGYARQEDYTASLAAMDRYVGGEVPIYAHFTANGEREMSYPIGAEREYFLPDWSPFDGRVGLALQSCSEGQNGLTSAGRQGASTDYARKRVHLGVSESARGNLALNSRICLFETMATSELFGRCTEEYGCLRDFEMLCCPPTDARFPPFAGFGNGCRFQDGTVL